MRPRSGSTWRSPARKDLWCPSGAGTPVRPAPAWNSARSSVLPNSLDLLWIGGGTVSTASFPQTHPCHAVRVRPYVVQEHQHEDRGWKHGPEQKRTLVLHVHQVHDAHERLDTRQTEQGEEQGSHRQMLIGQNHFNPHDDHQPNHDAYVRTHSRFLIR